MDHLQTLKIYYFHIPPTVVTIWKRSIYKQKSNHKITIFILGPCIHAVYCVCYLFWQNMDCGLIENDFVCFTSEVNMAYDTYMYQNTCIIYVYLMLYSRFLLFVWIIWYICECNDLFLVHMVCGSCTVGMCHFSCGVKFTNKNIHTVNVLIVPLSENG